MKMIRSIITSVAAATIFIPIWGTFVWASPDVATLSAVSQCTTDGTGGDGVRHACDSEVQTVTSPDGYVLAQNSLSGGLTSGNGSEQECHVSWTNFVEVIPNVTQPKTLKVRAHSRSPKGHWSGRGWAICKYTVILAPLPHTN